MHMSLDVDPADYQAFGGVGLIFAKEIMLEECKLGEDGEVSLAHVYKDSDLKDGVWVQMDKLDLVMAEQAMEEITGQEPEPVLEEGFGNDDFIGVRSRDVHILSRPPLENHVARKKGVMDRLEDLALINGGGPKHLKARSGHGGRVRILVQLVSEKKNGCKKK
jgi:hypothetical protein